MFVTIAGLGMFVAVTGLGVAPAATPTVDAVQISLNDTVFSTASPELEFRPGVSNVLRVALRQDCFAYGELVGVVSKVMPDGSVQTLEAVIEKDSSHEFVLGPMTAPPVYEFEAGVVYRRGYRLEIRLRDTEVGRGVYALNLYQGLLPDEVSKERGGTAGPERLIAGSERLIAGDQQRVPYHPMYGSEAPIALKLSDVVLHNPDAVIVLCRLNPGACVERLPCRLTIHGQDGTARLTRQIDLGPPGAWIEVKVPVVEWPADSYAVRVAPIVDGTAWEEGPSLTYHCHRHDPGEVRASPLAPWSMRRDTKREVIASTDLQDACAKWAGGQPKGWNFRVVEGLMRMECSPGVAAQPVELRIPAEGWYAVYARVHAEGCLFQVGQEAIFRPMKDLHETKAREVFVCAADMTGAPLRVFARDPDGKAASGLTSFRLVPVTQDSAEAFFRQTSSPPTPLYGVNDWGMFAHLAMRRDRNMFDILLATQAELGLRTLDWSIGRSWVSYHSKLPNTTRFPCVPLEEAAKTFPTAMDYRHWAKMINDWDPLQEVFAGREGFAVQIWPWLMMQRHYGVNARGGMLASRFFREHPQWWRWPKNASSSHKGTVCYFFSEVRQERIDILLEVANRGADGLLVGTCRQVPMLLYHPKMVDAYRKTTGVDPQQIDASQPEAYAAWIKWRANHFTEVLRGLRKGLVPIEQERGARIPVAVRIPSAGLFYNMAQGLDVEQWLRERLVDQIQLDPLEERGGRGSHDVRPYLELCRRHGVPVIGGVGATWGRPGEAHVAGMHRALGLLEAGVDGIEIYETELLALCSERRWVLPLFGNARQLRRFLAESNIEACYPVSASSAMYGHDNHSRWGSGWNVFGSGDGAL